MRFDVDGASVTIDPAAVIVAGFTGRNQAAVREHLDELAELGVPVPSEVPAFYPVPPELLVQSRTVRTWSDQSSGEAEIALVTTKDTRLVTLASDHTDRALETRDIHAAKLACPKIIAAEAWHHADVAEHWDHLILRSTLPGDVTYQNGTAAELLHPDDLATRLSVAPIAGAVVMLTGTVPAIGGIRPSDSFHAELVDPVLGRSITLSYDVTVAPVT